MVENFRGFLKCIGDGIWGLSRQRKGSDRSTLASSVRSNPMAEVVSIHTAERVSSVGPWFFVFCFLINAVHR